MQGICTHAQNETLNIIKLLASIPFLKIEKKEN